MLVPVWVSRLPIVVLVVAFVLVGVGFALGGLLLVRRYVIFRWRVDQDDSEFSGALLQGILVFYGLAVALIAVAVWQQHDNVSNIASSEASALGTLYRDVSLYPEPVRTEAQDAIRTYTQNIVDRAWPAAQRGSTETGGIELVDQLQAVIGGFEPATTGQAVVHAEVLDRFGAVVEQRRLRLDAVDDALSGVIWVIVLVGATLAVASSYFFQVEDFRLHGTLVGILGAFIALVVVLIAGYERPFVGDLAVSPDSYTLVLDTLMKR